MALQTVVPQGAQKTMAEGSDTVRDVLRLFTET